MSPHTAVVAAQVTTSGNLRVVHRTGPTDARPLASTVKLYVLAAVALAVQDHALSWSTSVTPTAADQSTGSGGTAQAGVPMSVQRLAGLMMSISDNTAASALIRTLGQDRLQQALRVTHNSDPAKLAPFLTLHQDIWLNWSPSPAAASARSVWRTAGAAERARLIAQADGVPDPAPGGTTWPQGLGYFASADDIARVLLWLHEASSAPGLSALSSIVNPASGSLDQLVEPAGWRTWGFKSGSAGGIGCGSWYAHTSGGDVILVVLASSEGSVGSVYPLASRYAAQLAATPTSPRKNYLVQPNCASSRRREAH